MRSIKEQVSRKVGIAIREVLGKDEWYALHERDAIDKAERLIRRLRAKGLDVVEDEVGE